jgi:hypothetical protein
MAIQLNNILSEIGSFIHLFFLDGRGRPLGFLAMTV